MQIDLLHFVAIYVAYAVPICLLLWVSRRVPATWPAPPRIVLDRPWLDFSAAIGAAVLILLLNTAYNTDRLLPLPKNLLLNHLVFLADLAIIWSPLALVLILRRQGLETCLLSLRGLPRKLVWAVGMSILGMAVFLVVERRFSALGLAVTLLWRFDPIQAIQSILQFLGMGFLLVRLAGVAGRTTAALLCGALYGLVKYPYLRGAYGMSLFSTAGIIAFSIVVALALVYVVFDRGDVLVLAILHLYLWTLIQQP
jgi:hypothetical protein